VPTTVTHEAKGAERPVDIATASTLRFVSEWLPAPTTVVEVGCGQGDLAVALQTRGYTVTAIDSDRGAVRSALAKGVNAITGEWPAVSVTPADAIVFTRSLHHVANLDAAVARAHQILRGTRTLLIEDFDFGSADEATANWFASAVRVADDTGLLLPDRDEFAIRVMQARNALGEWHTDHGHEVHSLQHIIEAVSRRFNLLSVEAAPYCYRYLIPVIEETPRAARCVAQILDEEVRSGSSGTIRLIGRRIVATAA
jgi:SAM-dependent methyltransferase